MPTSTRRTIARTAEVRGIGLHTGTTVTARLSPAAPESGIAVRRTDLDAEPIRATADNATSAQRGTTLGPEEASVRTVEHVLAAAYALGLDDLLIEVDGPEVPIGDGSAQAWLDALSEAGTTEQEGRAPTVWSVTAPLTVREGDACYIIAPGSGLRLTVTIEWDHPLIGRQSRCVDVSAEAFAADLARARTFGFVADREALQAQGLALGASEDTILGLTDSGLAAGELRWPDEFVRHKTLDLIGDLALVGGRIDAEIVAFRPSHAGNVAVARALRRLGTLRTPPVMGIQDILGTLPHRYPLLLVDRIVEIQGNERIVGIKNVTFNEPFFQGHFPEHPVMPGVLIVEGMAQAGGMLLMGAVEEPETKVVYFMSLDGVKFRRPVVPGDQLRFELEMLQFRGRNCRMRGVAYVDGDRVAEAEMAARIIDR